MKTFKRPRLRLAVLLALICWPSVPSSGAVDTPATGRVVVDLDLAEPLARHGFEPAAVWLTPLDAQASDLPFEHEIAAGQTRATFDQVPAGGWRVSAVARPTDGAGEEASTSEILDLQPGETDRVELAFDHRLFEGRVTLRGMPVEGDIHLWPVPADGRPAPYLHLDETGRFAVPLAESGSYRLELQAEDPSLWRASATVVSLESPGREVVVELPTGRLEGRVERSDGTPVVGARIIALGDVAPSGPDAGPGRVRRVSRSGQDGSFRIDAVSAGAWRLHAMLPESTGGGRGPEVVEAVATDEWVTDVRLQVPAPIGPTSSPAP